MEYTRLRGTGLEVSRLCAGTLTFGDRLDEKSAVNAVKYAVDQGVNYFDTSNNYADGQAEVILGKAVKGFRDKIIINSKVGRPMGDEPNRKGLSRMHILTEVEGSLRRLGTDYIDIYFMHRPDFGTPVEETMETLDMLVRSGKVRYIGVSNNPAWQICKMIYESKNNGWARPVVTEMVYNMITRGIEQELVPFQKSFGIGMVAYNPIAAGFLTDKYAAKQVLPNTRFAYDKHYNERYWNEENLGAWDAIRAIAEKAGISMLDLAMRWVYTTGNADSIITGFTRQEQLEQNLRSLDAGPLSADVMAACDEIWKSLAGTRFQYNR